MAGCNVHAAVDTKNHLIVADEITNNGNDRAQLSSMAQEACDATGIDGSKAIADRGYCSELGLKACEDAAVSALAP